MGMQLFYCGAIFSLIFMITIAVISPYDLHAAFPPDSTVTIKGTNLYDDEVGNSMGWQPDNKTRFFIIPDSAVSRLTSTIVLNLVSYAVGEDHLAPICQVSWIIKGAFEFDCTVAPIRGDQLHYTVINQDTKVLTPLIPYSERRNLTIDGNEIGTNTTAEIHEHLILRNLTN